MNTTNKMILTLFLLLNSYFFPQAQNQDHYKTIKKMENIEIREYNESINISYFDSGSTSYFRYLADYIFGGNEKQQEISMTSPVTMRRHGEQEMIFRLPNIFLSESAPKPNNNKIKIFKLKPNIKAAIRYSGYTNSRIEKKKTKELIKALEKNNIKHNNNFEVDVYNSPYQFINRRNEITVTINTGF